MTRCEFCGSRVVKFRVADDFTAEGKPVYVARFRCEDCGVVDGVAPARRAVRCVWPEGCSSGADVGRVCFDHFVMTREEWAASAARAVTS